MGTYGNPESEWPQPALVASKARPKHHYLRLNEIIADAGRGVDCPKLLRQALKYRPKAVLVGIIDRLTEVDFTFAVPAAQLVLTAIAASTKISLFTCPLNGLPSSFQNDLICWPFEFCRPMRKSCSKGV